MPELIFFYVFSAVVLVGGILMVSSRNIYHSALYLALSLFGVACIFGLLGAFFLAGIQVLLYTGAVVILTIFVISLTRQLTGGSAPQVSGQVLPAGLIAVFSAAFIITAVLKMNWTAGLPPAAVQSPAGKGITAIGKQFLTGFVLPFEAISVLLLAALLGAVITVSKDRGGSG